jgi:hypothetical protein
LIEHYYVERLDDVRVTRKKGPSKIAFAKTGSILSIAADKGRNYGFLRFPSMEEAEIFMDRNYPSIYLYGDSSKTPGKPGDAKVRISFGKEKRDNRSDDMDWICPTVCNFLTRTRSSH